MSQTQKIRIDIKAQHTNCIKVFCAEKNIFDVLEQEFCVHSVFEQVINLEGCNTKDIICFSSKYLARYTFQVSQETINLLKNSIPNKISLKIHDIKSCSLSQDNNSLKLLSSLHSTESLINTLQSQITANPISNFNLLEQNFQKNIQKQEILISNIMGLGNGLTPSGDDFIVGYLSAAFSFNYNTLHIIEYIKTHSHKLTNSISASYLINAANRLFTTPLLELICARNITEFQDRTNFIIKNIGSTSGRDLILGIIAFLKGHKLIVNN